MLLKLKRYFGFACLGLSALAQAQDAIREEDLRANPALLHQILSFSVQQQQYDLMQALLPLYRESPEQDAFLLQYAEILALREQGYWGEAIEQLQALTQQEALPFLQFQLAQWQYQNFNEKAARETLADLRQKELPENLLPALDNLESALQKRDEWRFNGSAYYIYDPNINSAPVKRQHGNWTFEAPKKGHGAHFEVSAGRNFNLGNGWFVPLNFNADLDWYWTAHEADDLRLRAETGLGWRNARHEYQIAPFIERRTLGDRGYSITQGAQASWKFRPQAQWQTRLYHQSAYERHDRRKHMNGMRLATGASVTYQANLQRYYFAGLSHFYHGAEQNDDRYHHFSANVGVGQSWDNGLNTEINYQIAHRRSLGKDLFQVKRRDVQHRVRLRGSHEKIQWKGFLPQLVVNFKNINSNHFYYKRPWEAQAHVEIEKRF